MRQRAMVAIALACDPQLLIADEPTTALDVTIQAQVLDLIRSLKRKTNAAIVLISHDLGVIAEICDEVAVMYAGEIVEHAPVDALFEVPQHPYTIGLLASIPRLDRRVETLATIEGSLPDMSEVPQGCRFAPRCPFASEICVGSRAAHREHWRQTLVALCQSAIGRGAPVSAPLLEVEGLRRHFSPVALLSDDRPRPLKPWME